MIEKYGPGWAGRRSLTGSRAMAELKIGMVGLDTSHVKGFADSYNNVESEYYIPGVRITKAFPGGSAKFSLSRERVGEFTQCAKNDYSIAIVESIEELSDCDAFLLESVDGDQHLEEFRILAQYGKPVFIDKPLACNYTDAQAIARLAGEANIPIFTSSSMRYTAGVGDLLQAGAEVIAADAFGPLMFLPDYRNYFWYGIHTAETLYRYLGTGCESVRALSHGSIELVIGWWKDGRVGQISGNSAGCNTFGVRLVTPEKHVTGVQDTSVSYMFALAKEVLHFFQSGVSPVPLEESLEIIAFLESASRSRENGGETVYLNQLLNERN